MVEDKRQNVAHSFNRGFIMPNKTFNLTIVNDLPKESGDVDELENFRFSNGRGFPVSYKTFVREFGYGLTLEQFHIYLPMGDYGDSVFVRSAEIKNTYIDDVLNDDIWFEIEPDGTKEILIRLYPFASSDNGLYLFWDTDSFDNNEFDIFITDFRGIGFKKIATDLYKCLEELTKGYKIRKELPFAISPMKNIFEVSKVQQA